MKGCLAEGILQSYADGELSPIEMRTTETHLANCTECAAAFSNVECEMRFVANLIALPSTLEIPSERLRQKLGLAMAAQPATSSYSPATKLRCWFSGATQWMFQHPAGASAYAAILLVAAAALFAATFRGAPVPAEISANQPSYPYQGVFRTPEASGGSLAGAATSPAPNPGIDSEPGATTSAYPVVARPRTALNAPKFLTVKAAFRPGAYQDNLLPGEESYLKTIVALSNRIRSREVTTMAPSLRAEYERNLAIVDHAIDTTRQAARRNPTNPEATDFLLTAYESKIDFLRAVTEQNEVASIR